MLKKYIVFFCILAFTISLVGCKQDSVSGGPTLPGADEIYPTVMVEEELYEWRHGKAILEKLPDNSTHYASIEHSDKEIPSENNEFVSTFDATGDIYTIPNDNSCVYLRISTDWMEESVVIFDKVS